MASHQRLDCLKCPGLCCRMSGYVEVTPHDIRRLAKHLGLSVAEFEAKHIVEKTRRGKKRIKLEDKTCQFLSAERSCTVYEARPKDCRGYVCWDQDDDTVYEFARFLQLPLATLKEMEEREKAER